MEEQETPENNNNDAVKTLMEHPEVNSAIENKIEILTERRKLLNEIEDFNSREFTNYKVVDSNHFSEVQNKLQETRENIANLGKDELKSVFSDIRNINTIEEKLNQQVNNQTRNNFQNTFDTQISSGLPKDTKDLVENINHYSKGDESKIFETEIDRKTYDANMIGFHNKQHSIKYMNDVRKDCNEMIDRNRQYEHLIKIL